MKPKQLSLSDPTLLLIQLSVFNCCRMYECWFIYDSGHLTCTDFWLRCNGLWVHMTAENFHRWGMGKQCVEVQWNLSITTTSIIKFIACDSFVYTSGHCRRWRSRMEVKIMAGSLFVHCKIAYFYSVTAEKWRIVSLPNFVTIRRTHFSISCKIFSWIRSTKLKIHAMEFCDFIKDSVSPSGLFVPCSLTVTSTWRPRLTAHCPIGERH